MTATDPAGAGPIPASVPASVLVANRGEIARRIFATARELGMATTAVYADADIDAPFVAEADQAVRLPTGYLDAAAIVAAAVRSGAACVHPGYGFLAENAAFAQAVIDAGLSWVGPAPKVIDAMGDKIAAKRTAETAGVPVLPSSENPDDAADIGFPLLVKASAGGGGKGMRLVAEPSQLADAVASARREAASAFGDDRVFLERYVDRSRHIEIQILGDGHGNLVHLGERECSIQRRHQKIIEEAPSVRVDNELRRTMGDAALALARSIGYQSAGTVEFLVDDETGEFFFLEVNTRLQVEHPVTEEVTGIDLVRQQFLVAAGRALEFGQSDVIWSGHAVEARLYAEDPENGFLPATGRVEAWRPSHRPTVRWDSGIEADSTIGVEFDPMLAKVIGHGPTRSEAVGRLARALERLHLGGVTTNRDYLVTVLRSPAFAAGDTTTDFIERFPPTIGFEPDQLHEAAVVGAMWRQGDHRTADETWGFAPSNWRNAGLAPERSVFAHPSADEPITIAYRRRRDGSFDLESGETVEVLDWREDSVELIIDGLRRRYLVTEGDGRLHVQLPSTTVTLDIVPRFTVPGAETPAGGLVAPMPGSVVDVRCVVGDEVTAGQVLVVLEAMKMEHHVSAPFDGIIAEVLITVGEQVDRDAPLITIDPTAVAGEAESGDNGRGEQNG